MAVQNYSNWGKRAIGEAILSLHRCEKGMELFCILELKSYFCSHNIYKNQTIFVAMADIRTDEKERIMQLRRELHEHNYRYYVLNQPTIGDEEFDHLMHELQQLESRHPELADPNSPTQRVGSDLSTEFRQVPHKYPRSVFSSFFVFIVVTPFF